MRCSKVRHEIDLQLDNELQQSRVKALELHLAQCSACRQYKVQAQELQRSLKSLLKPEFPSWLHHQILSQAAQHDKKRLSYKHRWQLRAIPVMLAIVLSITFGSLIGKVGYNIANPFPEQETTASAAQDDSQTLASFGESTLVDDGFISGGSNE